MDLGTELTYLAPTVDQPSIFEIDEMSDDGEAFATDGCVVETDGQCSHGHVSWLIYLGYI